MHGRRGLCINPLQRLGHPVPMLKRQTQLGPERMTIADKIEPDVRDAVGTEAPFERGPDIVDAAAILREPRRFGSHTALDSK